MVDFLSPVSSCVTTHGSRDLEPAKDSEVKSPTLPAFELWIRQVFSVEKLAQSPASSFLDAANHHSHYD
jgi:hypothetical protein